jgi:hypothetical protein
MRWILAGVLCLVALVAGVYTVTGYLAQQHLPKDMHGNPVVLPTPPRAVLDRTDAVASVRGMRLRGPSTGLNVQLGELNEVDGVLDPPGFDAA